MYTAFPKIFRSLFKKKKKKTTNYFNKLGKEKNIQKLFLLLHNKILISLRKVKRGLF